MYNTKLPTVVSVSPVALPTRAYATGSGTPLPASSPARRSHEVTVTFGSSKLAGSKPPSVAQQRAIAIQDAHRKCGERPHLPENRTPTVLKGFKEADLHVQASPHVEGSAASDAVSIEQLAKRPWEVPRVDRELMRDPYLRKYGLHKNSVALQSHVMRRILEKRTFHDDGTKVDFNTAWY
jgi:hypothetical protein